MTDATSPPLIRELLTQDAYPHSVGTIRLCETHISWVLLTGEFAYKIKKPIDLSFVDFTTLERRRHFCQEEVRLNRRFAPDLYLDVIPVTKCDDRVRIGGDGATIEYAVQMRRFDQSQLASHLLANQQLTSEDMDELAQTVATLHGQADCVKDQPWGTTEGIAESALENISRLRPLINEPPRLRQLDAIEDWTVHSVARLSDRFTRRREQGFVRECHGDLHLGNIVRWQKVLTPFDCIEFNPSFRWIDLMNEVGFLMMDLDDHGHPDLRWRFLNAYLERTGDYAGLSVLTFYLVYRAMVRAKVDALRLRQSGLSHDEQNKLTDEWHGYLDLAVRYITSHAVSLTITHGFSGSGKTTGTQRLVEQHGAIRIRSDIERKRLFQFDPNDDVTTTVESGVYSRDATERTYDRLLLLSRQILTAGFPVIVDATFLERKRRQRFSILAEELGVPFQIAEFNADPDILRQRILQRRLSGKDASDANLDVLANQLRTYEPLNDVERSRILSPTGPDMKRESAPDR